MGNSPSKLADLDGFVRLDQRTIKVAAGENGVLNGRLYADLRRALQTVRSVGKGCEIAGHADRKYV